MRRVSVISIVAVLLLGGCKSNEQKQRDVASQLQAVNDQLQKDCPKFDAKDDTGIAAALGQKATPEQKAAAEQHQREIQAKLNSPHCKEVQAKADDLYRQGLALQSQ
jgi:hypothetical protein